MTQSNAYSLLASLYQTAREAVDVARRAGLPIQFIEAEGSAMTVWSSILSQAKKRNILTAIQAVVEEDYPDVFISRGVLDLNEDRVAKPPSQVRSEFSLKPGDFERIMGLQPTFLPISFLERGLIRARSVARIVCQDESLASGFLLAGNLLVTNYHVLASQDDAANARAEFGYEMTDRGTMRAAVSFEFDPGSGFWTSETDDWTCVRLKGDANKEWGAIPLGSVKSEVGQFVNIIQHPGGGPKQIALYHNAVVFADSRRVQYLTDTLPGSSGSPVFNSNWELVALHHAGGNLKRPGTKEMAFCNEGIAVGVLVDALAGVA